MTDRGERGNRLGQARRARREQRGNEIMQRGAALARGGAGEMGDADCAGAPPRQRQRPGGEARSDGEAAESAQGDHRTADEIVARGSEAGPEPDEHLRRFRRRRGPAGSEPIGERSDRRPCEAVQRRVRFQRVMRRLIAISSCESRWSCI